MKRHLITAIVLLSLLFPFQASANDGYSGGVGETPMPRNSKDIVMAKEVVHVILHEDFAEVECAYQFKNTGKAQAVMMGFPERPHQDSDFLPITIFRAFIDGDEIPVKMTEVALKPGQFGYEEYGEKSNWFIQEVPFKAGETKVVVNRYLAPHGGTVSPASSYMTNFAYILHTGATWKDKLGRSDVSVTFAGGFTWDSFKPDVKAYEEIDYAVPQGDFVRPEGYRKTDTGVSWTFTNFEPKAPDDNISVGFFRDARVDGSDVPAASASSWLDTSSYKYPPSQAFDGDIQTAWAEGAAGAGIGESLKAVFNKPRKVAEVRILPGYTKRFDLFKKYSRPKAATLKFSEGTTMRVKLEDAPEVQYITLDTPIVAKWAELTIDDVYKGDVGADTYITEIEFASAKTPERLDALSKLGIKKESKPSTADDATTSAGEGTNSADATSAIETSAAQSSGKKQATKVFILQLVVVALGAAAAIFILNTRRRKGKRDT
ncbi:MAG: hypothetical protein QME41_03195 [Actinomycetota bacterium]|nr:hypothetical protein [Actinomycetota bacterium]